MNILKLSIKTFRRDFFEIKFRQILYRQRTANAAHPQMQELMRPLLKEFQQSIPILFDDINY